MRILMVSSYLPYPLHSGGQVRLYNLIKELADKHEITLVCEKRPNQTEEDIKELKKLCKKIVTVDRRKQWSLENVAKSGMSSHSFLVTGHTHPQMQQTIQRLLLDEKFDVIHVETFYVMQNLVSSIKYQVSSMPPIVLVEHNIEYLVYKRFMERAPLPLRPLLALDIAKIRKEEEALWHQANKVVAVSEEDKKIIEESGLKAAIVPNGVNIEEFSFKQKSFDTTSPHLSLKLRTTRKLHKARKMLFIGDFKWLQNRDSVTFIIKEIFPLIKQKDPNVKLWIVARNIPDQIKRLTTDSDVLFDEKSSTKSAPEIFQEADILLAPIRVGGGTSYKILESMSCGTPVVTMELSAKAMKATDGENILVGTSAKELAEKTVEVLENKKIYKELAKNGRKLIEENYSWKEIAKTLENVYEGVI